MADDKKDEAKKRDESKLLPTPAVDDKDNTRILPEIVTVKRWTGTKGEFVKADKDVKAALCKSKDGKLKFFVSSSTPGGLPNTPPAGSEITDSYGEVWVVTGDVRSSNGTYICDVKRK